MRYHLDNQKLKRLVLSHGYAHLTEFARAHGFNRATLNHFIKGKGPFSEAFYAICEALNADPLSLLTPVPESKFEELSEIMPIAGKLALFDNEIAVGLLGSRAKGKGRKYSDWDVGITRGRRPLGGVEFFRVKRIVEDIVDALPRHVDFINLDAAPEWFLHDIDYEPMYLVGDQSTWAYFLGVLHGTKRRK
ncbi:MAG: nucleotidyltransferase domain-containing protein [Pseudomonadota bacterium]